MKARFYSASCACAERLQQWSLERAVVDDFWIANGQRALRLYILNSNNFV